MNTKIILFINIIIVLLPGCATAPSEPTTPYITVEGTEYYFKESEIIETKWGDTLFKTSKGDCTPAHAYLVNKSNHGSNFDPETLRSFNIKDIFTLCNNLYFYQSVSGLLMGLFTDKTASSKISTEQMNSALEILEELGFESQIMYAKFGEQSNIKLHKEYSRPEILKTGGITTIRSQFYSYYNDDPDYTVFKSGDANGLTFNDVMIIFNAAPVNEKRGRDVLQVLGNVNSRNENGVSLLAYVLADCPWKQEDALVKIEKIEFIAKRGGDFSAPVYVYDEYFVPPAYKPFISTYCPNVNEGLRLTKSLAKHGAPIVGQPYPAIGKKINDLGVDIYPIYEIIFDYVLEGSLLDNEPSDEHKKRTTDYLKVIQYFLNAGASYNKSDLENVILPFIKKHANSQGQRIHFKYIYSTLKGENII